MLVEVYLYAMLPESSFLPSQKQQKNKQDVNLADIYIGYNMIYMFLALMFGKYTRTILIHSQEKKNSMNSGQLSFFPHLLGLGNDMKMRCQCSMIDCIFLLKSKQQTVRIREIMPCTKHRWPPSMSAFILQLVMLRGSLL